MVYIIIIFYTICLIVRYDINKRTQGFNFHYKILLCLSIGVVGFSYRLGMDTVGYMTYFENVNPNIYWTCTHLSDLRYEPVPEILFSICKSIWDDFTLVQFVIGIFVNTIIFWFLRKYSPMFFFSIFLYFIFQYWNLNFEIKRESIAIAFFLLAVNNILKDKCHKKDYLWYYVFCCFAIFSHRFAFLTLIYPFLKGLKMNRLTIFVLIFLSVLSLFGISYFSNILMSFNYIAASVVGDSLKNYLTSSRFGVGSISIFGFIYSIIFPIMILYQLKNHSNKYIFSFGVFFLICSILQSQVFIFYRLHNYFIWFIFLLYASFFSQITVEKVHKGIVTFVFLYIIAFQLYSRTLTSQHIRYAPYSSIFTKEYNYERESEYTRLDYILNY